MGKTWKYKSMFNLSMKEESFGDILYNAGVEVMAVDYDQFDSHEEIYSKAKELESQFKPDFVMGYCYGSFPASYCNSNKGLILLDPCARQSFVENSNIIDREAFIPLYQDDTEKKNQIISTPPLPVPLDKLTHRVNIFLSVENETSEQEDERGIKYRFIKNKKIQVIPNSSHWIMIESARYELANRILEIMNA
jgi:hypothetical protein